MAAVATASNAGSAAIPARTSWRASSTRSCRPSTQAWASRATAAQELTRSPDCSNSRTTTANFALTASGNVDPNTDASASEPSVAGVQR